MDKSPLRERDAGQKTNRLEPRLKETFAIDGSGSQNLEAAKTGSGTGRACSGGVRPFSMVDP